MSRELARAGNGKTPVETNVRAKLAAGSSESKKKAAGAEQVGVRFQSAQAGKIMKGMQDSTRQVLTKTMTFTAETAKTAFAKFSGAADVAFGKAQAFGSKALSALSNKAGAMLGKLSNTGMKGAPSAGIMAKDNASTPIVAKNGTGQAGKIAQGAQQILTKSMTFTAGTVKVAFAKFSGGTETAPGKSQVSGDKANMAGTERTSAPSATKDGAQTKAASTPIATRGEASTTAAGAERSGVQIQSTPIGKAVTFTAGTTNTALAKFSGGTETAPGKPQISADKAGAPLGKLDSAATDSASTPTTTKDSAPTKTASSTTLTTSVSTPITVRGEASVTAAGAERAASGATLAPATTTTTTNAATTQTAPLDAAPMGTTTSAASGVEVSGAQEGRAAVMLLDTPAAQEGFLMMGPHLQAAARRATASGKTLSMVYQLAENAHGAEFVSIATDDTGIVSGPAIDILLTDGGVDTDRNWVAQTGKGMLGGNDVILEPDANGCVFVTDSEGGIAQRVTMWIAGAETLYADIIAVRHFGEQQSRRS